MKKIRTLRKILSLFVTVVLVTAGWVVFNAKANATIVVATSDIMTRHKLSTISSHTLSVDMSAAQTLVAGETIIFQFKDLPSAGTWTFPLNTAWTTSDFTFNDGTARTVVTVGEAPTCTEGVNNVSVTADVTNKKLTVTACPTYTPSGAGAISTLTIGVAAGGTDRITNPGTAGRYEIWVTGTFGDSQSEAEVPILADDQVSVTATVDTYISFNVTTSNGSDNAINMGELDFAGNPVGDVTSSNDATRLDQAGSTLPADNISMTLDTNAYGGTIIQVKSLNGGLKSTANGYTLTSATETLAINQDTVGDTAGFGLQAQTAGTTQGTLTKQSPYDGATTAVGLVDSTFRSIYATPTNDNATSPIIGGTAVVYVQAVPAKNTPAGDDYADTLTFRATSTF